MYPVSEAYLAAIRAPVRTDRLTGQLALADGTVLELTAADLMSGSVTIDNQCVTGEELQFGCVYLGQAAFQLKTARSRAALYGARLTLTYRLLLADGGWYSLPLGVYTVAEAERRGVSISIKAYDNILALESAYDGVALQGTPGEMLAQIAAACGLTLGQTAEELAGLPNGGETFQLDGTDGCETWRDCVSAIAQAAGCFAAADRAGALVLRTFAPSPCVSLDRAARCEVRVSDYSCRYAGVAAGELAAFDEGAEGLTLDLGEAPLLQKGLESHRQALLEALLPVLRAAAYTPATLTMPGDPALECGDRITLPNSAEGEAPAMLVTHLVWKFHGLQTLKSVGRNPHLAGAFSREKRVLQRLQQESQRRQTIYYGFTNRQPLMVGGSEVQAASVLFATTEATSAVFLAQLLVQAEPEEAGGSLTLTVRYYLDGAPVEDFAPVQTLAAGAHALALFYPLSALAGRATASFGLRLSAVGGRVQVGLGQLRAVISGQGLAGRVRWDGRVEAEELLPILPLTGGAALRPLTEQAGPPATAVPTASLCQAALPALPLVCAVALGRLGEETIIE